MVSIESIGNYSKWTIEKKISVSLEYMFCPQEEPSLRGQGVETMWTEYVTDAQASM